MLRKFNWLLVLATLASAFALYAIKYDTRRLEARVQAQERALEKAENDVTILMAERTHLARPERLEPLARLIGLGPVTPAHYLRVDLQPGRGVPSPEGQGGGDTPTAAAGLPPTLSPSPHRVEDAPPARWGGEIRKR
jgi:cell division protein FtsL